MNDSRTAKLWNQNLYCFVFTEKVPENLQMELISLQCDVNQNQSSPKQNCTFFVTCQQKIFPEVMYFGFEIIKMFGKRLELRWGLCKSRYALACCQQNKYMHINHT
jgi:hypothetical protein